MKLLQKKEWGIKMFKKALYAFLAIAMFFSLLVPNASAFEGDVVGSDDSIDGGLNEGETVVDYTEVTPISIEDVTIPTFTEPLLPTLPTLPGLVDTMERRLVWYITNVQYYGQTYSPWYYAGASTLSGGVLTATHTRSVTNTFSGTLEVPLHTMTAAVGFDITDDYSVSVSYSTRDYPSGRYRLEYRHNYKTYKVKQEQKYDRRGTARATRYLYAKQWVERQYRVVKF